MVRLYYVVLLCYGFISCKSPFIEINGNYYRSLSENTRKKILPYSPTLLSDSNSNNCLIEVGSNDFVALINGNKNNLFYFYLPNCPILDISLFDSLWLKYNDTCQIFFVSRIYDLAALRQIRKSTNFPGPTYILKDKDFGHKKKKAHKRYNQLFSHFDTFHLIQDINLYYEVFITSNGELLDVFVDGEQLLADSTAVELR